MATLGAMFANTGVKKSRDTATESNKVDSLYKAERQCSTVL